MEKILKQLMALMLFALVCCANANTNDTKVMKAVDTETVADRIPTAGVINNLLAVNDDIEVEAIDNITVATSYINVEKQQDITEEVSEEESEEENDNTYYDESKTMYCVVDSLWCRSTPEVDNNNHLGSLQINDKVKVLGENGDWYIVRYVTYEAYVYKDYLDDEQVEIETSYSSNDTVTYTYSGEVLNRNNGRVYGPSGYETYYNLPMAGCIQLMNSLGYYGEVWVRSDGVKMWDDYVMVAANLHIYPKGTIVNTSLGKGIVVDTGSFTTNGSGTTFDIAVTW